VERWSYLDFVQKRAAWNYTVPPEGLGIWRQAALVVSLRHHLSMDNPTIYVPDEECQHAFELLQLPAPYDTHIEAAPGNHDLFLPCDGSQSGADLLSYAVVFVSKAPAHLLDAWADAPLFQHVLIPIAEDPNGPWQLGFMKAAAAYDGLDQPELAWNMLVSGQFWVTRRGGPWRPFFDAARSLARRREWLDCTAALNDIAARAQLPPA
jgi:hypothetical protein